MMTLSQAKLVGLIMKLDLKAREYKMLCGKLEQAKLDGAHPNGHTMQELLVEFQENNKEIVDIKRQLIELKESAPELKTEALMEEHKELLNQYGLEDVFPQKNNKNIEAPANLIVKDTKSNVFRTLLYKIKKLLHIG